jgi:hypothetical protein
VLIAGHEIPRRLLKTVAAMCAAPQTISAMYAHTVCVARTPFDNIVLSNWAGPLSDRILTWSSLI